MVITATSIRYCSLDYSPLPIVIAFVILKLRIQQIVSQYDNHNYITVHVINIHAWTFEYRLLFEHTCIVIMCGDYKCFNISKLF